MSDHRRAHVWLSPMPGPAIDATEWTRRGTALTLIESPTLRKEPLTASRRSRAAVAVLPTWVAERGPRRSWRRLPNSAFALLRHTSLPKPGVIGEERRNF